MAETDDGQYGVFCANCLAATTGASSKEAAEQAALADGWNLRPRERLGEAVGEWICPLCHEREIHHP
jgi:hypothetical protein